jgi:hypothetical protein
MPAIGRCQRGASLLGLLFWAVVVGAAALVVMKLFPLYNERWKVVAAMHAVAAQPGVAEMSVHDIRKFVLRNFEISELRHFDDRNLPKALTVERDEASKGRVMHFAYEIRRPFFGDLDIVLKLDERMPLPGKGLD